MPPPPTVAVFVREDPWTGLPSCHVSAAQAIWTVNMPHSTVIPKTDRLELVLHILMTFPFDM
jgi:hypothetical protein